MLILGRVSVRLKPPWSDGSEGVSLCQPTPGVIHNLSTAYPILIQKYYDGRKISRGFLKYYDGLISSRGYYDGCYQSRGLYSVLCMLWCVEVLSVYRRQCSTSNVPPPFGRAGLRPADCYVLQSGECILGGKYTKVGETLHIQPILYPQVGEVQCPTRSKTLQSGGSVHSDYEIQGQKGDFGAVLSYISI